MHRVQQNGDLSRIFGGDAYLHLAQSQVGILKKLFLSTITKQIDVNMYSLLGRLCNVDRVSQFFITLG